MMEIYFDKDFVKEFPLRLSSLQEELINDYFLFLRRLRQIRIKTNFTWDEFEYELKFNNNIILENLINLNPQEFIFSSQLDLGTKKNKITSTFSFFFAEDKNVVSYVNNWGFDCISSWNFNTKWRIYTGTRPDLCMKVTDQSDIADFLRFTSYRKIQNFKHPIHAIIIFDLYILVDRETQRIRDNLFPLLENLLSFPAKNQVVDLMIVTKFDKFNIKERYDRIKEFLDESFHDVRVHLSLVEYSKRYLPYKTASLKPRRIYTNYYLVKSDDSFTYFGPDGRINNTTDIEFKFVYYLLNREFLRSELRLIKRYIELVPFKESDSYNKPKILFYPDKRNRLLSGMD